MQRKLYLMRHGEAESSAGIPDFDRNLTENGQSEVIKRYREFLIAGYTPDLFLVSPILRAQQTFSKLQAEFSLNHKKYDSSALTYLSHPSAVLLELAGWTEGSIFLISHQPLIGDFIRKVTGQANLTVSTGSIHVLQFDPDSHWKSGKLINRFF